MWDGDARTGVWGRGTRDVGREIEDAGTRSRGRKQPMWLNNNKNNNNNNLVYPRQCL